MWTASARTRPEAPSRKRVSRGGLKLEKALKNFDVDVRDKVCTDVGSSTGGFTDCMLQNGAKKVYAIDVGRGQLDWKLRNDERVVCMEKTNIRYVLPEDIGEPVDFSSIDVSFISLTKVLTPIRDYLKPDGEIVALIKPQFEAGREKVGKKGVVREKSTHLEVIERVAAYAHTDCSVFVGRFVYLYDGDPVGKIIAEDFVDGLGHRVAGLSGSDEVDVPFFRKVPRTFADNKIGPLQAHY